MQMVWKSSKWWYKSLMMRTRIIKMVNAVIKNKSECNVGHVALISVKFSMSNIQGSSWLWQFPTWFYKIRSCYDNTLEIENCEFVPFYCPKINLCLYKILMTWVMFFVLYLYIVGEILCNVIAVTKNRDEFFYYYVRLIGGNVEIL